MDRRNRAHRPVSEPGVPILALLSHDGQLMETVQAAARSKWSVVKPGIAQLFGLIREPNVKLVIFDDQLIAASERGRAMAEIRRCAPKASIIYVTGQHDQANEKQARSGGVLFYTAKPLVPLDVELLLQRLLQV